MNRIIFIAVFVFGAVYGANAQYWFGVKAGGQLSMHDYLSTTYEDSFNIESNYNIQGGAIFSYTANKTYSVQAELYYKRIGKEVENTVFVTPAKTFQLDHYLTAPFMFRVNFHFGGSPFSLYANGGIELNYWLGGHGGWDLETIKEFLSEEELANKYPVQYKIVFREKQRDSDSGLLNQKKWIEDPNRVQYAVTAGFGAAFEFANGSRILLDARYTRAHSNMGFNGSFDFTEEEYFENFEYRPHQIALTLGYQIEYNAQLARKGKSTNRMSNH